MVLGSTEADAMVLLLSWNGSSFYCLPALSYSSLSQWRCRREQCWLFNSFQSNLKFKSFSVSFAAFKQKGVLLKEGTLFFEGFFYCEVNVILYSSSRLCLTLYALPRLSTPHVLLSKMEVFFPWEVGRSVTEMVE